MIRWLVEVLANRMEDNVACPSDFEIFIGRRRERQEWPILETAQVWTDNVKELKNRGVMTGLDLYKLEREYGDWATHLALSYGKPIWLARQGHIEASKRAIVDRARHLWLTQRKRH